jgi:hypothetical protein
VCCHEGRLDAAAALHDQATERWTAYGHLPERGHALLAAGRCLAELGRPGAQERLAEARAVFTELGALPLLAMAGGGAAETERPA